MATWGTGSDFIRTTGTEFDPETEGTAPQHVTGLGVAEYVEVRTLRARSGAGRPVVCADGRRRVTLPSIDRGEIVGAASVNGTYVAWRVARVGRAGVVRVGRVVRGRLRDVRRTGTVRGTRGNLVNGAFVVTETGTVAWTIKTASGRRPATVWVRGARPTAVRPDGGVRITDHDDDEGRVWVLDDQHVVVGGVRVRYRPARAGSCPKLFGAVWRPLGGWQIAVAGLEDTGQGNESASEAFYVTCDPARGDYIDTTTTFYSGDQYDGGGTTMGTQARNDGLLIQERIGYAAQGGATSVRILDTATGVAYEAPGLLDAPGIARLPPSTNPDVGLRSIGAAIVPGATAWITQSADGARIMTLWLHDATGTRKVTSGTPRLANPELTTDRLTWTSNGTPAFAGITATIGRPFALTTDPR